jgi:hypothetical protein
LFFSGFLGCLCLFFFGGSGLVDNLDFFLLLVGLFINSDGLFLYCLGCFLRGFFLLFDCLGGFLSGFRCLLLLWRSRWSGCRRCRIR